MPNQYFQFKQFIIQQKKAALKVSTDSCLFGAYCSNWLTGKEFKPKCILDIGAGTGLLMLMLAQKINTTIDGIEMDEPSFYQAKENTEASGWKERLHLLHADAKEFQFQQQYDFIISNPPFYEGDLKSTANHKNVAKHDDGLKLNELINIVERLLTGEGKFAVLLPYHRSKEFIDDANKNGLHLLEEINVRQTTAHSFFRSILIFEKKNAEKTISEISIKNSNGSYTGEFIELLKDYYLYM